MFDRLFSIPTWGRMGVILIGELFFQIYDIYFAQFFNLPYFPVFFSNYWNVNNLDIFGSGEVHEWGQNASVYRYISPIIPNFGNYGKNALR